MNELDAQLHPVTARRHREPFSFGDNTERRIAYAILVIDVPLAMYAYYFLSNQAQTLTGPGAFNKGTDLLIPVLFWGGGIGASKPRQSLNYALMCLITLLFTISHSALLTIAACALLVAGLLWNWLGRQN
jgi:hypothetical protein